MTLVKRAVVFSAVLTFWAQHLTWPQGPASPSATPCPLVAAAIRVASDTGRVIVVDSTSAGVPGFAFRARTSYGRTRSPEGFELTDSLVQALQTNNRYREYLGSCLATLPGVRPIRDDTLLEFFRSGQHSWERFRAAYPGVRRFILVSRPVFLTADSTEALIYVAYASDWLAGEGAIVWFRRDASGGWTRRSELILWVS